MPWASIEMPPIRCSCQSIARSWSGAIASTTRTASATTSGPIPSPGNSATDTSGTRAPPIDDDDGERTGAPRRGGPARRRSGSPSRRPCPMAGARAPTATRPMCANASGGLRVAGSRDPSPRRARLERGREAASGDAAPGVARGPIGPGAEQPIATRGHGAAAQLRRALPACSGGGRSSPSPALYKGERLGSAAALRDLRRRAGVAGGPSSISPAGCAVVALRRAPVPRVPDAPRRAGPRSASLWQVWRAAGVPHAGAGRTALDATLAACSAPPAVRTVPGRTPGRRSAPRPRRRSPVESRRGRSSSACGGAPAAVTPCPRAVRTMRRWFREGRWLAERGRRDRCRRPVRTGIRRPQAKAVVTGPSRS